MTTTANVTKTEVMERVFEFHGSDAEYIKYLEKQLLKVHPLPSQALSPNSPPLSPSSANETIFSESLTHCSTAPWQDDGLQFVHYDPQTRRMPQSQPQWKTDLRKLLQSIPRLDKWEEKREQVGTPTVEKNRLAIQIMLGWSSEVISVPQNDESLEIPELLPDDNFGMISNACEYGSRTRNSTMNMEFSVLLAKYQQIVFISYCVVLLDVGNAAETVNWMLRRYVSDSGPKNLMRYRSGCLWVNRCVASLLSQGWGYKSWEIFLLCAQPTHRYGRLADASTESLATFTRAMGVAQVPISEGGWIPYCIPSIIKVIAGDNLE